MKFCGKKMKDRMEWRINKLFLSEWKYILKTHYPNSIVQSPIYSHRFLIKSLLYLASWAFSWSSNLNTAHCQCISVLIQQVDYPKGENEKFFQRMARARHHRQLRSTYYEKVRIWIQVSALFASEQRYAFGSFSTQASALIVTDLLAFVCK